MRFSRVMQEEFEVAEVCFDHQGYGFGPDVDVSA